MLLPLAIVAVSESGYLEQRFGEPLDEAWEVSCLFVSFTGLLLRALTVGFVPGGTSGRNTKKQRAETLNTTGLYATVRNPLYLGNYLVLLGVVLAIKVWWFVLLACLVLALYYERVICAEETFLQQKFGKAYTDWAARTPVFIPKPWRWRRPELPFSLRTVLRREYNGLLFIVVAFPLIEVVDDVLLQAKPFAIWLREDLHWPVFFGVGAAIFLLLRTLKKHTRFLRVPGR